MASTNTSTKDRKIGFLSKIASEFSATGTALSLVILQPVEVAKARLFGEVHLNTPPPKLSPYDFLKTTFKSSPLSLWYGTSHSLLVKVPSAFSLCYSNVLMREYFKSDTNDFLPKFYHEGLMGVVSGVSASLVTHHLDVALSMSDKTKNELVVLSKLPNIYKSLYLNNGISGVYRYNSISSIQLGVFGGVFFGLSHSLPYVKAEIDLFERAERFLYEHDVIAALGTSYVACLGATLVSYPFEVLKTRGSLSLREKPAEMIKQIYVQDGMLGFVFLWRLALVSSVSSASLLFVFEHFVK